MYASSLGAWSAVGCLLLCLINHGTVGDSARSSPMQQAPRKRSAVPPDSPYRDIVASPDHRRDSARLPSVRDIAYLNNADVQARRDAKEREKTAYAEYAVANRQPTGRNSPARRADRHYEEAGGMRDEEMMRKMTMLDSILFGDDENDVVLRNTIEDEAGAETGIPEETKRVVRQVRKQRPGFFWTLARLAFETFNDTRSAIQQISNIISENFEPDVTSAKPPVKSSPLKIANKTTTTTTPSAPDQSDMPSNTMSINVTTTTTTTTTTTPRPFRFTSSGVQDLIRRNLRGLVRLFNIEWQEALNQSETTVREFQKDLNNQVGSFLQDNPNAF